MFIVYGMWMLRPVICTLPVMGGTGIDVVVHLFDASPKTDYLIIKGGKLSQMRRR